MAKDKKMVDEITSMDEDFAKWYTDICMKAELVSYTSVKGCMVIRPYGYAIWENIQHILDTKFKELGHENVCMPMFIPESLLQKEKDHVEGFAPEVAWVTYGGSEKLEDRLCVRPTSETLCSAISIRKRFIPTEIFLSFTISGYLLYVGKKQQDHFFVQESSCGRRVILSTRHLRRLSRRQRECSTYTLISASSSLLCRS